MNFSAFNEADTRCNLIDPLLVKAGRNLSDRTHIWFERQVDVYDASVLANFDAIHIVLTAASSHCIDRYTIRFFENDETKPTFLFKYDEVVEEVYLRNSGNNMKEKYFILYEIEELMKFTTNKQHSNE